MTSSTLSGMLLSALAFALFTGFDTTVKYLSRDYSVLQIMGLECLLGAALVLGWTLFSAKGRLRTELTVKKPLLHLLRGFCQATSNVLFFIAFTHMPLTEFYVILFIIPILVMLLAGLFLKERITTTLVIALFLSFAGVLVALKPGEGFNSWTLLAFAGTLFNAAGILVLRRMTHTETPGMMAMSVNLAMATVLIPALFSWKALTPEAVALVFLGGFFFGGGQVLIANAIRLAGAALGTAPQFLQLIYGAVAGYVVFGDVPASSVYLGGALVIAANIYLLAVQQKKPVT